MQNRWGMAGIAALLCLGCVASAMAVEVPTAEWEHMKQQIAELQSKGATTMPTTSMVDTAMENKFGPNANVSTKTGKLQISGLLQVWYYAIQQDRKGFFNDPAVNGIKDDNSIQENNGFRIRRTELKFTMDINENWSGVVMIDPAREADGFPSFPSNVGNDKKSNLVSAESVAVAATKSNGNNSTGTTVSVQGGAFTSGPPRLLQDAYINFHGCVPYHDFQIGQYKPWCGEEGIRSSGELDFAERSMLGNQNDTRDLGASVHGSFWGKDSNDRNGRVQYWAGVFNGGASYFNTGKQQNKPDNNNSKDFNVRLLVRPLWDDCMGHMEIGGSFMGGRHGDGKNGDPILTPVAGLNRPVNGAARWNAWASYMAPGDLQGLWVRGEYSWIRDREDPNSVLDTQGTGGSAGVDFGQNIGNPFSKQGVYGAAGYKFGDSCWGKNGMPCWLKPVEILGRYERFQNIETADLVQPAKTDAFYTQVWTLGVNYYIKGHNAKVQANYNNVQNPADHRSTAQGFHNVRNDSFVIDFQLSF